MGWGQGVVEGVAVHYGVVGMDLGSERVVMQTARVM